jgi:hypothetical protein
MSGVRQALFGDVGCSCEHSSIAGVGFGDLLCFDSDCDYGRNAIREMQKYFSDAESPAEYKTAVDSLQADADALEAKTHIPFSNYCCQWKTLGQRADKMTTAIAAAKSLQLPAPDPAGQPGFLDKIGTVGQVVLVAAVGVGTYHLIDQRRQQRRQAAAVRRR